MSVRVSMSRAPSACSGLMYSGVPINHPGLGEYRLFGELLFGSLGQTEVDDLRYRRPIALHHQDVGRLQVAVNDAFLVRVLRR
jgi:hypothetical protein